MGLAEAVERQNQSLREVTYTANWLKRHLDKSLSVIESERGFDPIPLKGPFKYEPLNSDEPVPLDRGPFVTPYQRPAPHTEDGSQEKNLRYLQCIINLNSMGTTSSMFLIEDQIENFRQRLERIAPDPNTPS
jgi:hypothetical protein